MIELEDVESGTGYILNIQNVEEVGSDKIEFGDCDILFSKLEPYLGKAIINDPSEEYIGSTEWIPLNVYDEYAEKEYIWCLLISSAGKKVFRLLQSGKRHARINIDDFMNILVPDIPGTEQTETVKLLHPKWEEMNKIRSILMGIKEAADEKLVTSLEHGSSSSIP